MLLFPKFAADFTLLDLIPLVQEILDSEQKEIDIDASNTVFIDPVGMCIFASLCETLARKGRRIKLHNLNSTIESYLSRMDLLKQCGYEYTENFKRLDRRDSLVEVNCVDLQKDVERVSRQVSKCIVGKTPDFDENAPYDEMTGSQPHTQLEENLNYLFNELLENSLTHGRRHGYRDSNVWVASQYYPHRDTLKLGIVDNGCGFFKTLESHPEAPNDDAEAIELALKPYASCNRDVGLSSDSHNEGVGLTVISRIVGHATGEMNLFSGDTLNKYKSGKLTLSQSFKTQSWRGVGISISMPREAIKEVLYREVVSELHDETNDSKDEIDINFI